jgi:hypothetical protein
VAGCCEQGNERFCFVNEGLDEELLASQGKLCSIEMCSLGLYGHYTVCYA